MVDDGQVPLATFMSYQNPASSLIWAPVSILHRYVAKILMARRDNPSPSQPIKFSPGEARSTVSATERDI